MSIKWLVGVVVASMIMSAMGLAMVVLIPGGIAYAAGLFVVAGVVGCLV